MPGTNSILDTIHSVTEGGEYVSDLDYVAVGEVIEWADEAFEVLRTTREVLETVTYSDEKIAVVRRAVYDVLRKVEE